MIYYFTGTGNSRFISEELEKLTDIKSIDIKDIYPFHDLEDKDEFIGLVFPVHAWGVPKIFLEFLSHLKTNDKQYIFSIIQFGDEAGLALEMLKKYIRVDYARSIQMPNNYILSFDVDSIEVTKEKLSKARSKLITISHNILMKNRGYDVYQGPLKRIKTKLIYPFFNKYMMSTKGFTVSNACISCGLCEKNCIVKAIKLDENGRPVWIKPSCTKCLSCIHCCPKQAINYGKSTIKKGRYHFKSTLLNP